MVDRYEMKQYEGMVEGVGRTIDPCADPVRARLTLALGAITLVFMYYPHSFKCTSRYSCDVQSV